MSKRKLNLIIEPSDVFSVSCRPLKDVHVEANACLHSYALDRMLDFYLMHTDTQQEENYSACADVLVKLVSNHTSDKIGPFIPGNWPNAKTFSGIFAGTLQHLLSSCLFKNQPRIAEYLVCTGQKLVDGNVDATIYKNEKGKGLHPRMLFMFSAMDDQQKKCAQLLAYANNSSLVIGKHLQLLMTGCVVVINATAPPILQVFAYVTVLPPPSEDDGQGARIATIPIFDGAWNRHNVKRLLRTIHGVLSLPQSAYEVVDDSHLLPYSRVRENVLIRDNTVFKIYDYRGRAEGERLPRMNLKYIAGCETVVQDGNLTLIRYPLVEGDHVAQLGTDFIGVLRHLSQVHGDNNLHMDIRVGNMIFNHTDGTKSRLIDFDYSNLEGLASYPSRFNPNIRDGARHRDAVRSGMGIKAHDLFSMSRVMALFEPVDSLHTAQWQDWLQRVQLEGQLLAVADELEQGGGFELRLIETLDVGPTGTSSEMQALRKRKHEASVDVGAAKLIDEK